MILLFRKLKKVTALAFILCVFLFTGCQKDESEYIFPTNGNTVTTDAVITNLLSRASQNEGSWDDIIDDVSCAAIQFPVTVIVNGQELTLHNQSDIDLVLEIIELFPNDVDSIQLVFPVTYILWDYSVVTVNNQSELNDLLSLCSTVNQNNDEITCLDLVFPISIYTYNINQEQTGQVVINNNQELFIFIQNLDENDLYSIDFPISVIVDGETIIVTGSQQLQVLIEDCVENDGDDELIDQTEFENNLTTGSWYITYYFDDYDETSDFAGYEFTFYTNETAQANNGSNTVTGEWKFYGGSTPKLELDFGNANPLDELDEDWEIIEANNDIIRLRYYDDDESVDYLTFERNSNASGNDEDLNNLIQHLTTDSWFVNLFSDNGESETCYYTEYEFVFNLNGTVQAQNDSDTITGYWTALYDDGILELILNFDYSNNEYFEELNDDWNVLLSSNAAINLQDISGENGDTYLLNFGRTPFNDCGSSGATVQEVKNILEDGQWLIASYTDVGEDETSDFTGYTFTFNTGGDVMVTNDSKTYEGDWTVIINNSNLELILDFGETETLEELNDDWDIIEALVNKVTLQDVSGGGGGETDSLIFQKL